MTITAISRISQSLTRDNTKLLLASFIVWSLASDGDTILIGQLCLPDWLHDEMRCNLAPLSKVGVEVGCVLRGRVKAQCLSDGPDFGNPDIQKFGYPENWLSGLETPRPPKKHQMKH